MKKLGYLAFALSLALFPGAHADAFFKKGGAAYNNPSQLRVLLIGDSTIYGRGGNPGGTAGVTGSYPFSPARVLAAKLTTDNRPSSSMSVVGMGANANASSTELYYNTANSDVNVTLNGWDQLVFNSIGGNIYSSTTTGQILKFSFTNIDRMAIGLPIRSYGTIHYRYDGGAWTSVNQTGSDNLLRITNSFSTYGAHTVEFESVGSTQVYVNYVEAWNSTDKTIIVPWGARGYTSAQFNDTTRPWSYKSALSYVPFDAIVLDMGINDVNTGVDQATYTANVDAYIQAVRAANASAKIFLQIPNDISGGLSYVPSVLATLAVTYGATLIDSRGAANMVDYTTANGAGLMYDTLHPNGTAYALIWNYFEPTIKVTL